MFLFSNNARCFTGNRNLNSDQIRKYAEDGYCVINNVLTDNEVAELIKAIESCEQFQKHLVNGNNKFDFHLPEITTFNETFLKYTKHPKIVAVLKQILGEDIHLHHSKLTVKLPSGSNKDAESEIVPWHQDFPHFPHSNTSLLGIMIALVDFTPEIGCMKIIPKSHKLGILNHRNPDGTEAKECIDPILQSLNSNAVDVMPKKGGISVHHCLALHSSGPNFTNQPRYSLVFEYRSRDAYLYSGRLWKDTGLVIAGKDHAAPLNIRSEQLVIPVQKSTRFTSTAYGDTFNQYSHYILSQSEKPLYSYLESIKETQNKELAERKDGAEQKIYSKL